MFAIAHHVDCYAGRTLRFLRDESLIEITGSSVPGIRAALRGRPGGAATRRLMKPLSDHGLVVEVPDQTERSSRDFPAQLRRLFSKDGYPSGLWAMRVYRRVYLVNWTAEFWADAGARFLECLLGSQDKRVQFLAARSLWRGPRTLATEFFTPAEERWLIAQSERWAAVSRGPSVALLEPIRKKILTSFSLTEAWDAAALFRPGGPCVTKHHRKFSRAGRPFHVAIVQSGVTNADHITEWPVLGSNGRADEIKTAEVKACAEAFERWVNGFVVPARLVKASLRELGPDAVDPRHVVAYAGWQYRRERFPFIRFDPRRSAYWVKGQSMVDGKQRYLLAETIFYPFPYAAQRFTYASSSGSAAHATARAAEECALAELVERDAFMAHWLLRKPMRPIKPESLPAELQAVSRECSKRQWQVTLFDITLDAGVVILAFAAHRDPTQGWILGAACSWDEPFAAAQHALGEVNLAVLYHTAGDRKACPPRKVRSVEDHGRLYCNPAYQKRAAFLLRGSPIRFSELAVRADAAAVTRGTLLSTSSAVSVDLTAQLPFLPPYAAVKVVVPGLIPISFGYGLEPFGLARLPALAQRLGLRRTFRPTVPHPFT